MRRLLFLLPLVLFAQEGFFYYIFRGDTVCVEPIVIDTETESEWFSYGSASIHTGFEEPYETHFYLFYNTTTDNSGMAIVHNEDIGGTASASCNLYMEDLPFGTSLTISDDPSHAHGGSTGRPCGSAQEFDLACWPQGGWYWGSNTDGGAFYYPATDEWEMSFRYTFGGSDPIKSTWFISGATGADIHRLDTVYVGNEDTLYVGHATYYLSVDPTEIDTIVYGAGGSFDFGLSVFNSCDAESDVEIRGVTHTNSLFWTIAGPTSIAPCTAESVLVGFTAPVPGVYVDTVEIKGPFNCNVAFSVITVTVIDSLPSISPIGFTEDTLCDFQNMGEFCFTVNLLDTTLSAWGSLYAGAVPDTTFFPGFTFPYTEVTEGEYCFDWNMGLHLPDTTGLFTFRVQTDTIMRCCEGGTPLRSDGTVPSVLLLGEFPGSGDTDYGEIDPMTDYYPGDLVAGESWFLATPTVGTGEIDFRDAYGWTGSANHAFVQFYVCSPYGGLAELGGYVDDDYIVWKDGVLLAADTDDLPDYIYAPLALEPCTWSRITVWSTSPTPVDWYIRLTVSLDGPLMTSPYIPSGTGYAIDTFYTGIIDTRPPEIYIDCAEDDFEESEFTWEFTVADPYLQLPFTATIACCGWDTTFETSDTFVTWIPHAECTDCQFILSARDSFCNISYDTCNFEVFPLCSAYITDASMVEETFCNDSNLVQICYEFVSSCPDSLYDIDISISDNGGSSWDVPITSLIDADEHLFDVAPGSHCFQWIMSDDLPFEEGEDFRLRVRLFSSSGLEDELIVPATLDSDTPSVSISPVPGWLVVGEEYEFNFYVDDISFELSCSLRLICCGTDTAFSISDWSFTWTPPELCTDCSLYVFATDSFCNSSVGVMDFEVRPLVCYAQISDLTFEEETNCDGENSVEICFRLDTSCPDSVYDLELLIAVDGTTFSPGPFTLIDAERALGEDIGRGRYCFFWILSEDFPGIEEDLARMTVQIDYIDTLWSTDTTRGVLDSRPPDIEILCPPAALSAGDSMYLSASVTDANPSLSGVTYFLSTGDTLIGGPDVSTPVPSTCDELIISAEVRDAFCNISYSDACTSTVCTRLLTNTICMPCGSYSSCFGQTMTFSILPNPCDSPVDEFWGRLVHISGGIPTEYILDTSSEHIFLTDHSDSLIVTVDGFTFTDTDSVYLTIDSLRSVDGCITR